MTLQIVSYRIQCEYDFLLFLREGLEVPDMVHGHISDNLHVRAVNILIITRKLL